MSCSREEACVLVHGAEGKDATLLVTALAQVILDPACRTLAGFQGLLEREWIQVVAGDSSKEIDMLAGEFWEMRSTLKNCHDWKARKYILYFLTQ